MDNRRRKKPDKGFKDISHYFLSAAEADVPENAVGAAGHQAREIPPMLSDDSAAGSPRPLQPMRRKENCASCAHLIARSGQPFQCRVYSVEHLAFKVQAKESVDLNQGHSCPFFMRVTSRQIEEILRSHGSELSAGRLRDSPHHVEEQFTHEKTITVEPFGGMSAEEALREELLRYLMDGYSIVDATVVLEEDVSDGKHHRAKTSRVRLRVKPRG